MMKIGFDNDKYLKIQSEHIRERIAQFDGKLYMELGGKLFDDHHASRVLPGFKPDSKLLRISRRTRYVLTWASPTTRMCFVCVMSSCVATSS